MEEPKKSNLWLIILCVFAFLIICMGAVFNNRFEKEHGDITAKNKTTTEETEAEEGLLSESERAQLKESLGNITTVVLRQSSASNADSYSYELSYKDDKLLFSCTYSKGDQVVVLKDEEVGNNRMSEVKEIIDRYTVATVIRQYRKDPQSVVIESDDNHALEITWYEGDYINLGFPNGAGPALEKYFKKLADWMVGE